ncbi:MAG TPA: DUF438 domain-containing protein [Candidatus Coatesbacteria bacterium]|nr:DUF438 domain-containing protein [Candidatus Coatesbacteria bacterium]
MSGFDDERQRRKQRLKEMIRRLHAGEAPEELKGEFRELLAQADASVVAELEQELIAEGLPAAEVQRLCDVHAALFEEGLSRAPEPELPPGHPARTLLTENRLLRARLARLRELTNVLDELPGAFEAKKTELVALFDDLAQLERHYLRKENQLFPVLERRGIRGPTQVMWGIHDEIRGHLKAARSALESADLQGFLAAAKAFAEKAEAMAVKEERVLVPMSLETLSAAEWAEVKAGEAEIGYAWHTPVESPKPKEGKVEEKPDGRALNLSTGALTPEQLDLLLTHLPVDLTFVDEKDEVRYYSAGRERIFPRSPAVIGRRVQNCHPPDSVEVVERIVASFKSGEKDSAEFWLNIGGRLVYIRYFAVRDAAGAYRGVLEVSQDVTAIRALEGERRLLDW